MTQVKRKERREKEEKEKERWLSTTTTMTTITTTITPGSTTSTVQVSTTTTTSITDQSPCPILKVAGESASDDLAVLRQFRDDVMVKSSEGLSLVSLYYAHSQELTDILSEHPDLMKKAKACILEITPAIKRGLQERGQIRLTKLQRQQIIGLLKVIEQESSPGLKKSISLVMKFFKSEEQLKQIGVFFDIQ
jgi:hypothetical protein